MSSLRGKNRGAALFVGLIMLLLLTLVTIAAFKMGRGSFDVVSNMQQKDAVVAAANDTIQQVLSTTRMFQSPDTVFLTPCKTANTLCFDVNGDGKDDITVKLDPKPACVVAQTIKNSNLDLSNAQDAGCLVGAPQNYGIEGAVTGDSLCADSVWEVNAKATDNVTNAATTVTEGVAVRVATANISESCPN